MHYKVLLNASGNLLIQVVMFVEYLLIMHYKVLLNASGNLLIQVYVCGVFGDLEKGF